MAASPTPASPVSSGPEWIGAVERRRLLGSATLRRVGRRRFPALELVQDDELIASLDRFGWVRIFLGRGQQIVLADGESWRLRSVEVAGDVCPVVVDSSARKVAIAAPGVGNYGINGKDYGYLLNPEDPRRMQRADTWKLHHFEDELATLTRRPLSIEAVRPVPLGAVFLSFALVRFGIPGESRLPRMRWG